MAQQYFTLNFLPLFIMSDQATLNVGDSTYQINVLTGTENEQALDVRQLRK